MRYENLTNAQKARFNNFKKRYGKSNQEILNQIEREIEHKYTNFEKGNVHHFMTTRWYRHLIQAHNEIMKHRESEKKSVPMPPGWGKSYMMNR